VFKVLITKLSAEKELIKQNVQHMHRNKAKTLLWQKCMMFSVQIYFN